MRIFYLFSLSLCLHFYILNISPFIVHAKRPFMHPLPPFLMNIVLSKQHSDPFSSSKNHADIAQSMSLILRT